MLLNAALACIFVLTGTFRQLLTFKGEQAQKLG